MKVPYYKTIFCQCKTVHCICEFNNDSDNSESNDNQNNDNQTDCFSFRMEKMDYDLWNEFNNDLLKKTDNQLNNDIESSYEDKSNQLNNDIESSYDR